jgi:GNAT superfamily N-acetyltransferase
LTLAGFLVDMARLTLRVMDIRPVALDDVDAAVETITLAFSQDPVWRAALQAPNGAEEHLRPYWRHYVEAAFRHGTAFVGGQAATVSVWTPPDETELSEAQEAALRTLAEAALEPTRARALFELWDRFDENHPHDKRHAYLSLLATRPDLAGHGYGQAHLATDLTRWDAAGVPTYLESSNPSNNHRYERQGYVKIGQFETVLDCALITTMWRPVGG